MKLTRWTLSGLALEEMHGESLALMILALLLAGAAGIAAGLW